MKTKKKKTKKVIKKKITKKIVKKVVKKKAVNKEKKLGKVTHYFDKIKVAAIKLNDDLLVGQTIRIEGGESTDFKQKIVSMQFMGEKIKKGKKKQEIGIKVKEKVREGYKVFKVS
jgi:putative protease